MAKKMTHDIEIKFNKKENCLEVFYSKPQYKRQAEVLLSKIDKLLVKLNIEDWDKFSLKTDV